MRSQGQGGGKAVEGQGQGSEKTRTGQCRTAPTLGWRLSSLPGGGSRRGPATGPARRCSPCAAATARHRPGFGPGHDCGCSTGRCRSPANLKDPRSAIRRHKKDVRQTEPPELIADRRSFSRARRRLWLGLCSELGRSVWPVFTPRLTMLDSAPTRSYASVRPIAAGESCHSAAPPSLFSRRFNTDGEGVSAK